MKRSLYLIALVIILGACTQKASQSEQGEEQLSEDSTAIEANELEPTISGSELMGIINSGDPIPQRYVTSLLAVDQTYEATFENLYEDEKFISGKLTAQPVSFSGSDEVFLCSFNKSTGKLLASLPFGTKQTGALLTTYEIYPELGNYNRFWLTQKASVQEVSEGQSLWDVVKDATTYEYALDFKGEYELIDSAKTCYEWLLKDISQKKKLPHFYLAGVGIEFENEYLRDDKDFYLETISQNKDYLFGKLTMKSYNANDSLDRETSFFCSFSKKCGIMTSFVNLSTYSIKYDPQPDEYRIETLSEGDNPVFNINVKEYITGWSAEANAHVTSVHRDETKKYYIQDYGQISTDEFISEDAYSFLDFIARLKKGEDVSAYGKEDYYYSFMTLDYGGPVIFNHLAGNDKFQVFRAKWGEMEAVLDRIWVYNNTGKRLSECGDLPAPDVSVEVGSIAIDTVSLSPVVINFAVGWTEFEVVETGEMPERGDKIKDMEATFQLTVDKDGKCKMVQL